MCGSNLYETDVYISLKDLFVKIQIRIQSDFTPLHMWITGHKQLMTSPKSNMSCRHVAMTKDLGGRERGGVKKIWGAAVRAGAKSEGTCTPHASPLPTCLSWFLCNCRYIWLIM